jgi:GDPmannose 4,6-dehydratase
VSEKTSKKPLCLYAISKITAGNLIEYYRKHHHIKASIYYLFNHESNLRGQDYFISKVVLTLKKAIEDRSYKAEFHSLNFYCDWGSASEYMLLMFNAAESKPKLDMIIASGKTIYAKKLVTELFEKNGLDFKDHITEKFQLENPHCFQVDISRLVKTVNSPKIEIAEVVQGML